jgi:hypothetical protein
MNVRSKFVERKRKGFSNSIEANKIQRNLSRKLDYELVSCKGLSS